MKTIPESGFTSRFLNSLRTAFDFQPGEGWPLSLLIAHSCALAIGVQVSYIAGNALFLAKFNVDSLPYVYIGSGLIVTAIGYAYEKLALRVSVGRLWTVGLLAILTSIAAFRGVFAFTDSKWPTMVFLMWWEAIECLGILEFWALAGRIFNIRQAKRLFPLIGCGEEIAIIPAGLIIPLVVPFIGTKNLLIVAAIGVLVSLFLMTYIVRAFPDRIAVKGEDEDEEDEEGGASFSELIKNRYLRLIFITSVMTIIMFYLVNFSFYDRVETRYPDESKLAGFFGIYYAVQSAACLLLRTVGGRLINRYGLSLGILGLPCMILLGTMPAVTIGSFSALAGLFFWLVIATNLFDDVLRSVIEEPSVLVLYQPLPPEQRIGAQTAVEGYIKPFSGLVIGVVLLVLTKSFDFKAIHALYMLVPVLLVWIFFAARLRKEYTGTLMGALSRRIMGGERLSLNDDASVEILKKGLASAHPGEVIYSLKMLEEIAHDSLEASTISLLDHSTPEVRRYAAQTVERRGMKAALNDLTIRLEKEIDPAVRGTVIRTLCALGELETDMQMKKFLSDPSPQIRKGAMVGLLRSGGIEGVLAAGERFLSMIHSASASDRVLAAQVLGDVEVQSFYSPLLTLLADPDAAVQREAIKASGRIANPRLWPLLIEKLSSHPVAGDACAALAKAGPSVVPILDEAFERPGQTHDIRARLIRICGHIEGSDAGAMLIKKLQFPDEKIRGEILRSLKLRGFSAGQNEIPIVRTMIHDEVADVAWTLAAIVDVGDDAVSGADILTRSLRHEIFLNQDRTFLLLSFLYPPEPILRARANLNIDSDEKRSYAVEIVDSLLSQDLKNIVIPLIDDITHDQRLKRLYDSFPQKALGRTERLKLLITRPPAQSSAWSRACSVHAASRLCFDSLRDVIEEARRDSHPLVRETAERALAVNGG